MKHYLSILGKHVQDRVTGMKGVATTVGFDLYGCVQVIVTPEVTQGKYEEGRWFDHKRLIELGGVAMSPPSFEIVAGPEAKGIPPSNPLR